MMHGPCGTLNPNSVCMRDGKCSKEFPKDFNEYTRESINGYPVDNIHYTDVEIIQQVLMCGAHLSIIVLLCHTIHIY